MDISYYKNDSGKLTAKRLPSSPKNASVKFKDTSDVTGFGYDLVDFPPDTNQQFTHLYERNFTCPFDYDVEVESFFDVVSKNRHKFLGCHSWLKTYAYELQELMETQDDDWQQLDDTISNYLLISNFAEIKDTLSIDDWCDSLQSLKLAELRVLAKPFGIKVSQRKDSLIDDLVSYHFANGENVLTKPI
ncbi:hypothetical protein, partial [Shewanella algae]|uniref:hypothetical protein n=1 Tax=Shewanella algae TaxID=38313 RepID=UPI001F3C8AC0